jgi:hypothetical protein
MQDMFFTLALAAFLDSNQSGTPPFCKSFVGREGKRNKLMQTLDWTWQQHTTSLFFFFYLLF